MLNKPNYIERAVIDSPSIRFTWDEWNVRATYEPADERLVESLMKLSKRANCAFTIAIAEWIVYRFQPLDRDPQPLRYLEAAWAANIDLAYADEMDIVDDEWRGPVRGPISMALTFVIDALFAEEAKPNAPFDPAWAAKFARHVLPDQTQFDEWFDACLVRLRTYFPPPDEADLDLFDESRNGGLWVPREAFDPRLDFKPEMIPSFIEHFLGGLDPASNSFLRSPQQMRQIGFRGTPYRI